MTLVYDDIFHHGVIFIMLYNEVLAFWNRLAFINTLACDYELNESFQSVASCDTVCLSAFPSLCLLCLFV